jgi:hypothetical protein
MSYAFSTSLSLGSSRAGKSLAAQLFDITGANITDVLTDGFVEIGQGHYLWTYSAFPDGFRGGIKFYDQVDLSVILAITAVNPEEIEYSTIIENLVSSPKQVEIKAPTLVSSNNTNVSSGTVVGNNVQIITKSSPVNGGSINITQGTSRSQSTVNITTGVG